MGKVVGILATVGQIVNIGALAYSPFVQSFWSQHAALAGVVTIVLQIVAHFAPAPTAQKTV
jgi:hypothetical protein